MATPATSVLLQLSHISKKYVSPGSMESLVVLNDLSLELGVGDSVAIIGPSGSGKSTILNIIGTLDRASSGLIWLNGRSITELADEVLADIRNREIGFIFQSHHLLPQLTAMENVLLPILAFRCSSEDREKAAERGKSLLARVGLGGRFSHRPGQLSGGERQRVAVVRALINRPRLILADEPTGALDLQSANQLGKLLVELNREEQTALVVVTHSMDLARQMGKVFELSSGQLKPVQV